MSTARIEVKGLAALRRALKELDPLDARKEFQVALKAAAGLVATVAKGKVPSRSGRAAGSIRAVSGGNKAFVVGGKAKVPYYGWLDFGGRNPISGRPRSVGPWAGSGAGPAKGRFIYPALDETRPAVIEAVELACDKAIKAVGF